MSIILNKSRFYKKEHRTPFDCDRNLTCLVLADFVYGIFLTKVLPNIILIKASLTE